MFKSYFKSILDRLLILTLSSSLLCTLWINLTDADYVNVADEGESKIIQFKCGLHLTSDTTVYSSKLDQNKLQLVYALNEKKNTNASVGHLQGRAGLYLDSDHVILHIPSLQISDTGYYEFTGSCKDIIVLKVQGKPVLKLNGADSGDKANLHNDEMGDIICEKEGLNSSIMKVKLNEDLPGTTEYSESKINNVHLKIATLKTSHKFTVDDIDKILTCSSDDSKLERKVHIDVTVKATVSITKVGSVKAGEEVTLACTSAGRPATEMHWLKADTQLSGVNTNPTPYGKLMKIENHLKFTPSIEDNTKKMSCVVTDGSTKDEMTLNVTYVPILDLSAETNEITENSTIQFICSVNANPLPSSVIWMKDDTIFAEGKTENKGLLKYLTIEKVNRRHRGHYSCKAENSDGTSESTKIDLRVKYPPIAMLTVNNDNNSNQFIEQNTKVVVLCITLDAYPENTSFAFYKNNTPLRVENNELLLSKSDSAMYSCILTNDLGTGQSDVFINVGYAPDFVKVNSESVSVKNGSLTTTASCSGNGNPVPVIKWLFEGNEVATGSQLVFDRPITPHDDGKYSCKASNQYGSQSGEINLKVLYAPVCTNIVKQNKYPQQTLTLTCLVNSNPRPTSFSWFRNEEISVVGITDTYDVTSDGNSTYYCEAQNDEGVSTPRCEFKIVVSEVAAAADITQIVVPVVIILLTLLLASIIIIIIIRRRKSKVKGHAGYELNQSERNSPGSDINNTSDNTPNPSEEITYQNVGRVDEAVYQNVNKPQKPPPPKKKNPDGVIYADLEISRSKNGPNNAKPDRKEQPTEYAIIDFTKKAPPVEAVTKPEPIYYNSTTLAETNGQTKSPAPAAPPRRTLQSNV